MHFDNKGSIFTLKFTILVHNVKLKLHFYLYLFSGPDHVKAYKKIHNEFRKQYPGHILPEKDLQWIFVNAGGWMGSMCLLHASLTEYILFFGSAVDTVGHSGSTNSQNLATNRIYFPIHVLLCIYLTLNLVLPGHPSGRNSYPSGRNSYPSGRKMLQHAMDFVRSEQLY